MRLRLTGVVATVLMMTHSAGAAGWQAGTAQAKITPEEPIWMGGFGFRDHPSEGALMDTWAQALALRDPSGRTGVLVTIDVVGIDRDFSNRVRDAIQKAHGLERDAIVLACSHTHSGPVVGRNLIGTYPLEDSHREAIARYTDRLEKTIPDIVAKAIANLSPAALGWGQGHCGFAVNRRNNDWGSDIESRRDTLTVQGPVDHDVPVFAVQDAAGKLRAVVCVYACHTSVLRPYQIHPDYAGYLRTALEAKYPGVQAMYVAGCGGDQGAFPRNTLEIAQKYGNQLADAVIGVVDGHLQPITAGWTQSYEEIPLDFASIPDRDGWEKDLQLSGGIDEGGNRARKNRARAMLEILDKGGSIPTTYPYPIQLWRFGPDLDWFFLGGEVTVGYALRIKANLGASRTFVAAYSNDVMNYIPTKTVLEEGDYEAVDNVWFYGQPAPWSDRVEEQVIAGVREILSKSGPHPALIAPANP